MMEKKSHWSTKLQIWNASQATGQVQTEALWNPFEKEGDPKMDSRWGRWGRREPQGPGRPWAGAIAIAAWPGASHPGRWLWRGQRGPWAGASSTLRGPDKTKCLNCRPRGYGPSTEVSWQLDQKSLASRSRGSYWLIIYCCISAYETWMLSIF